LEFSKNQLSEWLSPTETNNRFASKVKNVDEFFCSCKRSKTITGKANQIYAYSYYGIVLNNFKNFSTSFPQFFRNFFRRAFSKKASAAC